MEELLKKAADLGIVIYKAEPVEDIYLTKWYDYMIESGEWETIFTNELRPLSRFLANFQSPRICAFYPDPETGCKLAVWFVPFDGNTSAFMNYWVHPDTRGTSLHYAATRIIYEVATRIWRVILGITKHEHLLRIHRKIGYNIVGQIPELLEGSDVWVLYLTRELFENSYFYKTKKE